MKTETELFENALDTTSVNGKKLREYINENYISNSVIDKIRTEVEQTSETIDGFLMHDGTKRTVLQILDKYKAERNTETSCEHCVNAKDFSEDGFYCRVKNEYCRADVSCEKFKPITDEWVEDLEQ